MADPLVGTAWLIALDSSSLMGPRYTDAREVANQFIGSLGPHDMAKLIIFDDRANVYRANSSWVPAAQKATLTAILAANPSPSPSSGPGRPFSTQIKNITKSFGDIGNTTGVAAVPMHQAFVLLSNGAGREDVNSPAAAAEVMKSYFNKGRFPDDNPLAPKTPLPVISIYFPSAHGFTNDKYASNDMQFMQDLSNPEIGGYFDIVFAKQGVEKSKTILSLVKTRFNQMWVVKWKLSCLGSTSTQSFNLVFTDPKQPVISDGTFTDVPIGVDPTTWPLDINVAQTKAEADANPVYPGGTFRVYGNFCWGGDKNRAEAYFVPAGTQPNPNVNKRDPNVAKQAMQNLVAQNMHGSAVETNDTSVTFNVPNEEKLLEGTGDAMVTRVVIYDNKARRASGYDAQTVLTLKAQTKPWPLAIILGAAGLVVVILLLVVVLLRGGGGGGGGKRRGNQPPPAPVVAGGVPPYGAPPYGGGAPPGGAPPYGGGGGGYPPQGGYGGGGGYGASPGAPPDAAYQAYSAPQASPHDARYVAPPPPVMSSPAPSPGGGALPLAGGPGDLARAQSSSPPGVMQVRCPSCGSMTMATPGQASVCFSCGQPLPRDVGAPAAGGGPAAVGACPLPGGMPSALTPPPTPSGGTPTRASIVGAAGRFAIRAGVEVRVGRDPAQCPITLTEPRVSGVHATLKFENGQLMVRDESSNNGTFVGGQRIPAGVWAPVANGAAIRFGPIELSARIE
jgi:hypothetical protein